jgi:hypothetical protein
VLDELATAFASSPDARALCFVIFSGEALDVLRDLPLGSMMPLEFSHVVVDICLASRWSREPSMLERLLTYLVNTRGAGALAVLLPRVRQRIDPNSSVYAASWVLGDHPFIDRQELRDRARRLVENNTTPILRVTGPANAVGRTYGRRYFEHLEDTLAGILHVIAAELSRGNGPSYEVDELAEALCSQMGVVESPPPRSLGGSYSSRLCQWVLRHALARPGIWLLVLDGFGQEGVKAEVREMIEAMASLIPTGQYRRRVRLVLVDYPHALPRVTPADTIEEILQSPEVLTSRDLIPCIEECNLRLRASGGVGIRPAAVSELAAGIVSRAPTSGRARLESFNEQLRGLLTLGRETTV